MPTYRYRCGTCGDDVEVWQSITDDSLATHDAIDGVTCDGPLTKVLSPAGIVLKGSGFYKTDNRSGGSRSTGDAKSDSKSDSKSDAKSDSTSDSKSSGSGSGDSGSGSNGSGSTSGTPSTSSSSSST